MKVHFLPACRAMQVLVLCLSLFVSSTLFAVVSVGMQVNAAYSQLDWSHFDSDFAYTSRGNGSAALGAEMDVHLGFLGSLMLGGFIYPKADYHSTDNAVTGTRKTWLWFIGSRHQLDLGSKLRLGAKLGFSFRHLINDRTQEEKTTSYEGQVFSPLLGVYLHYDWSKHYYMGLEYWHFMQRNKDDKLRNGVPSNQLFALTLGYHFGI